MTDKTIGLGFIGLSTGTAWAGRAHVPALRLVPGFEIRALATTRRETAEAAARLYGVPNFTSDAAELVNRPDIDLVVVAVRVPHHLELVELALGAGKAVYCEWPLGNGLAEAEKMSAMAGRATGRNFVGLQGRASPPLRYIRDLVASGHIGEVISTTLVASSGAGAATVEPRLLYGLDRRNGVSMLTVQFGHTIDGLCWALGEFTEISATLANRYPLVMRTDTGEMVGKTVDDQIAVHGLLENGAVASVHYRSGTSQAASFLWEINGSKADLVVTSSSGRLQYAELKVRGTTAAGGLEELAVPESYRLVPGRPGDMHYTLAQAYASVKADLCNGTSTVPDFSQALLRHRLLDAIEASSASGRRQSYL